MEQEPANFPEELTAYGALPSQLIDVSGDAEPRVLSYLDLRTGGPGWRRPVVVENAGRPCVHVFDGRQDLTSEQVRQWSRRIALRGDGAWVGVLEPGRLRVYRTDVEQNEVQPREVVTAKLGEWALPRFLNDVSAGQNDIARRRYLMTLLESSAREATTYGLSETDALSLVGRGLFWRFLVDRDLLTGLSPWDICPGAETWAQCLDTKTRALRTFHWLDVTFNGGLLPFSALPRGFDPAVFSSVLGNISHEATESGQMRLPTEWQEVNFSHVPVGLLSEVYEAFAYNLDPKHAAQNSVHYTPSHLVDFIISQALEQLPAGGKPRILDPAAGAGVFLVAAFRKLVERQWRETGKRPQRVRIRQILNEQLVGFDIDARALRLAELALYLTALELDPKPKPLAELKFDALRETALFDLSRTKLGSLGPVDMKFRGAFDLVVGNPPWTAKGKGLPAKKAWVIYTKDILRERLGWSRAEEFDFPDTNMDLPFVWRAMAWAKPRGRIALVTHARWLFGLSDRATRMRDDLLRATRITGILNGSALRLTNVWPEVDAPWCILFAANEVPGPFDRAAFQFLSPALDAPVDAAQARVRVDWLDAQTVLASEVIERPWTLKTRFRGNRLAARALDSMRQRGELLGRYLERLGTRLWNGYQVGGSAGTQIDASHMIGMPDTKGAGSLGFVVDVPALPKFARRTLLFPRNRKIYRAPLLLVAESISSDRLAPRASRIDADVAFHESFHGASLADVKGADHVARYLQLYLQSAAMVFVELLMDGRYGIERDALYQESLEQLPLVPFDALSGSQRDRMIRLSKRLTKEMSEALADELDEFIFDTFDLSDVEREAVRDTLATALPSTESKRNAVRVPNKTERKRFVAVLEDSLQNVVSASGTHATVRERANLHWDPWCILEVGISPSGAPSSVEAPMDAFLAAADENGASLVIVRASETTWFVGLLKRYSLWTSTRARLLATDLIAERSSP